MKSRLNPALVLSIASVFVVGVFMFHISWLKTPDILVDFGRELYVPWQLSEGKLLYKDLVYWNGPVSPYLNALIFSLFGASVHTLLAFNVVVIIAIAVLIFLLFMGKDDYLSGAATAITFLTLFAFAQYYRIGSYNFAAPYSHELTHGILLSLFSIYISRLYLSSGRTLYLVIVGLCVGLSLLTKVEIFVSLFCAILLWFALALWLERPSVKEGLKKAGYLIAGFFLPLVLSLIIFSQDLGLSGALRGILGSWYILVMTDIGTGLFQKSVMGLDAAVHNVSRLFTSLLWYLLIFAPLAIAAYLLGRKKAAGPFRVYASPLAAIVAGAVTWFFIPGLWSEILRPLPLLMAILLVIFFFMLVRNLRGERGASDRAVWIIGEMTFICFALAMLMKMFLKTHAAHYGFALAMPATLVLVKLLLEYIPDAMKSATNGSTIFKWGALGVVAVVIFLHLLIIRDSYEKKQYVVGSGSDTMVTYGPDTYPYGLAVNRTLAEIERNFAPDATFVAFPEGATLNFLSKRENPSGFLNYIPSEVTMFGEEAMLKALKNAPPDYIFKVHMDTTEYGHRFFGVHYGFMIDGWIRGNYSPAFLAGYPPLRDKRFGILILKRNEPD